MSMWIQHAYGKGNKIEDVRKEGLLTGGVILSPSAEGSDSLTQTSLAMRQQQVRCLLDTQSYVYSISDAGAKRHDEFDLVFDDMSWSQSPRQVASHVQRVIAANNRLRIREVIAPSPYMRSFRDYWTPMALQYPRAMLDAHDGPVFASVVVSAAAFDAWRDVADWLDAFTTLDVEGVYFVVATDPGVYPPIVDSARFVNILRTLHRLSVVNRYEVVWGYADLLGLPGIAVGVDGVATGWHLGQRMWTEAKWLPRTGGRAPNPRVLSEGLLTPLDAEADARAAGRSRFAERVFPAEELQQIFRTDAGWSLPDSWTQHLSLFAQLVGWLTAEDDAAQALVSWYEDAIALATEMNAAGLVLSPQPIRRLQICRAALVDFLSE